MEMSNTEQLQYNIESAHNAGYVAMPVRELFGDKADTSAPQWKDVMNAMFSASEKEGGRGGGDVFASVGNEMPIKELGTKDKGWMQWGVDNSLPNTIALLTSLLPYTAAGVKFNTDTAAGLGPKPMYRYSYYTNGAVVTKEIDFADAGEMLEGRLMEVHTNLSAFYERCRTKGVDLSKRLRTSKAEQTSDKDGQQDKGYMLYSAAATGDTAPAFGSQPNGDKGKDGTLKVTDAEIRANQQIEQRLLKQTLDAELAYNTWYRTNKELTTFLENNKLGQVYLQLFNDMCHLGICFPELNLSQDGSEKDTALWKPKITGIKYRSSLTCRLERMDSNNLINYVYVSNRWYDRGVIKSGESFQMAAFPALDPQSPTASLRAKVRDTRMLSFNGKKGKTGVPIGERPTRFILPSLYPTLGRPYYPQPAWWSIFGGKIYQYASTMIADRATAKENSNMWGKIVYIHTEYLAKIYQQSSLDTDDKRAAARNKIWNEINTFLKDKSNNGKTLLSFTFVGRDGKDTDAYRIVDVPQSDKSAADANKTELAEIASIIFFVLEIHPDLIGASPGRSGSSGGTYQREMYEMKKVAMAPTQRLVLAALDTVREFNEWDSHLVWNILQMSLTTLDRNANGVEETKV